jgi:hypothetical protein
MLYVVPVNTALVNAASVYQVNTGLVTVVLLAVKLTAAPEHIEDAGSPVIMISALVALDPRVTFTGVLLLTTLLEEPSA